MTPEPPNFGNSSFTLLSGNESPQSKRKKDGSKAQSIFPNRPSIRKPNPKYIIIASADDEPLSSYSCVLVHILLQSFSKDILSTAEMRDGNLFLLLKNKVVAERFLTTKELVV